MTSRERTLVVVFLSALFLFGGGASFHLFFWKPYSALRDRLLAAKKDIDAKQTEKKAEEDAIALAKKTDPRLTRWETVSLPDTPKRDADTLLVHIRNEQVDYEKDLAEMFKEARFSNYSANAKPVLYHLEGKDTPQLAANKTPTYTKLSYTIEAKATLNSIVDLLDNFYRAEKLHQVREFKVRKSSLNLAPRNQAQAPGQPPGIGMGAPPADDQADPNGQNGRDRNLLDVTMTVEALIVTGAKTKEARGPVAEKAPPARKERPAGKPGVPAVPDDWDFEEEEQAPAGADLATPPVITGILVPDRKYRDMLEKNMFTGVSTRGQFGDGQEDPRGVLGAVQLVMIERMDNVEGGWFDPPRVWRVEFRDQGAQKDARQFCLPDVADQNSFEIRDRFRAPVIKGTVVDVANVRGIVVKIETIGAKTDNRYYKMRIGDFFYDVTNPPRDEAGKVTLDPDREPMEKYTRGDWKGPTVEATALSDDVSSILKVVKLTKTVDTGRRLEALFNDPVRKRDYTTTPDSSVKNVFEIVDRKKVVVLKGTVVDVNGLGAVIKVNDKYYKMKIGDSFDDALYPALDAADTPRDPERAPLKEYKRGDWKAPPAPPPEAEEKKDPAK